MSDGWIKLHRGLKSWEWYGKPCTLALFIHLLLTANHKPHKKQGRIIAAGQLETGRKKLAEKTGLSEQQVRTALQHLEKTKEINQQPTKHYTLITIVNWEKYQTATNEQPTSNQQPTNDQPQYKKENNNKKEKKYIYEGEKVDSDSLFKVFWDQYPDNGGKGKNSAAFKGPKHTAQELFNDLLTANENYLSIIDQTDEYKKFIGANDIKCSHASTWLKSRSWETEYKTDAQEPAQDLTFYADVDGPWVARVKGWKEKGTWLEHLWGAPPDNKNTDAPPRVLVKLGVAQAE